jgi:hypothetical protein
MQRSFETTSEFSLISKAPGAGHASMHFLQLNRASQESAETIGASQGMLAEVEERPNIPNRNSRRDNRDSAEGARSGKAISEFVTLPSLAFNRYSRASTDWSFTRIVSLSVVCVWGVTVLLFATVIVASWFLPCFVWGSSPAL